MILKNKKIIVCVSGGIAAYKACELVRELIKSDAEVRVAMTKSATKFVTPLTFETLTNHEVAHEMFPDRFIATRHIDWADWADLLIFVPATANTIAKLAHGFSDDIVTTINLAFVGPRLIAPAMNTNMWNNSIFKENLDKLNAHGFVIMGTSVGELACGWVGEGRLAELNHIMQFVEYCLADKSYKDKHVVINAGPTIEELDPVRYVSNYSSGKMGIALAKAAWALGANVTLIIGPHSQSLPYEINVIQIQSAEDMLKQCRDVFVSADVFIGSAAISDYRPKDKAEQKIKKNDDTMTIELTKNPDVLMELGKIKKNQRLIGFALETENGKQHAEEKLKRKNLDAILLNESSASNPAFGSDSNNITLIKNDGTSSDLGLASKQELAYKIFKALN